MSGEVRLTPGWKGHPELCIRRPALLKVIDSLGGMRGTTRAFRVPELSLESQ